MRLFTLLFCLVLVSFEVFGQQSFQVSYPQAAPGLAHSSKVNVLGNTGYLLSSYNHNSSPRHHLLLRLDQQGDTLWTKQVGNNVGHAGRSVLAVSSGGYLLIGDALQGNAVTVTRLDSVANILWSKDYEGYSGSLNMVKVVETDDGGFAFSTWRSGDIDLTKINSSGNLEWHQSFVGGGTAVASYAEPRSGVQQTYDGGFIIASGTKSTLTPDASAIIIKTDTVGTLEWSRIIGGSMSDHFRDVVQTTDSGFVAVGLTESYGAGQQDVLMVKFDVNGNEQWSKVYGTPERDYAFGLNQYADGGLIVSGYTGPSSWGNTQVPFLFKTDEMGNLQWSNQLADTGLIYDQELTPDGGIVIAGARTHPGSSWDPWLIKSDPTGYMGCNTLSLSLAEINPTFITDPTVVTSSPTLIVHNNIDSIANSSPQVNHICDSAFNCNTINTSQTLVGCDSLIFNGNAYYGSQTVIDSLLNFAQCDSISTTTLIIHKSSSGIETITACGSYTWIDGNTYITSDSTATHALVNAVGCDSVVTLDLTINTVNTAITQAGFTLTADETGVAYQWLECPTMTPITGATNQSYAATTNGDYAVIVTDSLCSDTSACYTVTGIGIIENDFGKGLSIYPNPTAGDFSVDLGARYNNITVTISDAKGRIVQSTRHKQQQLLSLQIHEPTGVYLLMIEVTDQPATHAKRKAIVRLVVE